MKTGIIFDLDGTLLDTLEDLYEGVNYALRLYGCPERSREEVRRFVGNGARNLISKALPGKEDDPPLDKVLADYQVNYDRLCMAGKTCPFPGIEAQLALLAQRYPIAIVSNKPDISVKPLCEKYFPGVFALGTVEGMDKKPDPEMVRYAMAQLGVDKAVYVGDSEVDIATAKNAQLPCLTVLWGFRDRPELEQAGATHFCHRVSDMARLIEDLTV